MAIGLVDVRTLDVPRDEQFEVAPAVAVPGVEDSGYLGPASPETVARNIARRARIRLFAALAPLGFLLSLLIVVSGAGL